MNKSVILNLGNGDLQKGFESVSVRLEDGNTPLIQLTSSLPAAPEIAELYRHWQPLCLTLYEQMNFRIKVNTSNVKNFSEFEFSDLCQELANKITEWLNSESFHKVEQQLRTYLERSDEIQVIIETNNNLLRRLPWHLWNFFNDYPLAEAALSASEYRRVDKLSNNKTSSTKVRILAILGNSVGIDIQKDKTFIKQLSAQTEIEFLVEPHPETLNDQLWKQGWDILFFAGHSCSKKKGVLQLNQTDAITIGKLKHALEKAIRGGLKLAIFNSCDGLDLAEALASLHIPQVVVMREPVPDVVAQEFLKNFLQAFSNGQSLYVSMREAREQLKRLDFKYPCASWLPVICQNPAEKPTTWQELCTPQQPSSSLSLTDQPNRRLKSSYLGKAMKVLLASAIATASVIGVRHLGILQPWELQAFDQLMQMRADEKPDPRILVVTISETDLAAQNAELRRGSISHFALNKVLEEVEKLEPRAVGLDIYRDFPTPRQDLKNRFQNSELVVVCKARNVRSGDAGVAPPPGVPVERQGFSDVIQDPDGVVRRHLLAMDADPASPCTASYAFSVQLAMRYLAAEGKLPQATPEGFLQIGDVVFEPIKAHTSGYQQADTWGHQVLLNYRCASQNVADQVSLTQVLRGKLNRNLVKDRVVLIGTTAGSFNDLWTTPYSRMLDAQQLPGVLLQAQMVSQILSAVLDRRPLLGAWSISGEVLWIWGWSIVGGILAWRLRSPIHLLLAGGATFGVLYGFCFALFLQGSWVGCVAKTF